ncbi:MAG: hypothetical protein RLZZ126_712 [Pseudomonadota bacterium]|jgi:hypothetical protein
MDLHTTTLPPPGLEHICDLAVTVSPPIDAGVLHGLGTAGQRRIIPITGGVVTGRIQGRVLPGGADFQRLPAPADAASQACADLDARYLIALDGDHAGEHIFVMNRALRRASQADVAALSRGEVVDPARVYFRCAPQFEVSSPRLRWLTESIVVGAGARAPTGVSISFYRLL